MRKRFEVLNPKPHAIKWALYTAWYDLWVGAYWDRKNRRLYVQLLPGIGIVFWRHAGSWGWEP